MLKGIDPILNAEVLGALRAMGHGDDLIIADTNFPGAVGGAADGARAAAPDRRAGGAGGAGGAVGLSARRLRRRRGGADGDRRRVRTRCRQVQREVQAEIDAAEGKAWPMIGIERYRLLRAGEAGLCGDPDRRAAVLRLLRPAQGRDPAGGLRWARDEPRRHPRGLRRRHRLSGGADAADGRDDPRARASCSGRAARARTRRWRRRGSGRRCSLITRLGEDAFAEMALATWAEAGVRPAVTRVPDSYTGAAYIFIEEATGDNAIIITPGRGGDDRAGRPRRAGGADRAGRRSS